MNRLSNKIAIVTGVSRSNGIGTAVCRSFANEGADVFFTHWSKYDEQMEYVFENDWPDQLTMEIRKLGLRCEHMELDLSATDAHIRLLDEVNKKLGSPSILVNNATHCVNEDFRSLSAESLDLHCAVNVRGTMLLTVEFAQRINLVDLLVLLVLFPKLSLREYHKLAH